MNGLVMQVDWLPVTKFEQNCSILACEITRRAAVIDPGGDLYRILDYLEWEKLTLEVILITHGHIDHAGGAAKLAAATGARIEGPHEGDRELIRSLPQQGERCGIATESFTPDRWLGDRDHISFGQ